MKNIIIFSLITLLFLISENQVVTAQITLQSEGIEYNSLKVKKGNTQDVYLNDQVGSIISKFGVPSKNEPYEFQMDEKMGRLIQYGEDRFFELDNVFETFTIRSNQFQVGINGNYIQVGDNISKVARMYSAANQYKKGAGFYIPFSHDQQNIDGVLLIIYFNPDTWEIKTIKKYDAG